MQGINNGDNGNNFESSQSSGAPGEYPSVRADYSTQQIKDRTEERQEDSLEISGGQWCSD